MAISSGIAEAMRTTNDRFCSEVVQQRKISALDKVYTRDARILPPDTDVIEGGAAIQRFWQQAIEGMGINAASLTTMMAEAAGDTVVEIGRAELTLASGQVAVAKYVVHWKQEDGVWKWHTDIWNMNQ